MTAVVQSKSGARTDTSTSTRTELNRRSPRSTFQLSEIPANCRAIRGREKWRLPATTLATLLRSSKSSPVAPASKTVPQRRAGGESAAGLRCERQPFHYQRRERGRAASERKQELEKIKLNETIGNVAHAQWDGKYFALQSYTATKHNGENVFVHYIRVQVSGTTGTIAGISRFAGWRQKNAGQSWLQGNTLVATPGNSLNFWKYPAGGKAFKVLHPSDPSQAVTVSLAP